MTVATEFPTFAELLADVEYECDIDVSEDGEMVDQDEMIHYCNKAIDLAEKVICNIYKDYFLARDELTLVDGTEEYSFPSDIYGMKFRCLTYYDGSTNSVYEVERSRHHKEKFLDYRYKKQEGSTYNDDCYRYFIINESAGAPKLLISPTPGSGTIERWYWRQANRIVSTSDVMDIPEGKDLVLKYMTYRVVKKEFKGNLDAQDVIDAKNDLNEEIALFRNTMAEMVVDEAIEIEQDHSMYEDHE